MYTIRALVLLVLLCVPAFAGDKRQQTSPSWSRGFDAPELPDVLIYVIDDVSSRDLELYGGPVPTPNLAALAAMGTNYTRAYANATCSPTRRSILTGQWAVGESGSPCAAADPVRAPTLADTFIPEALFSHTSAIFGKWHLGGDPTGGNWEMAPISHGFDSWIAGHGANVASCGGRKYTDWLRAEASSSGGASFYETDYEPLVVRDEFIAWWSATRGPHLAYVAQQLAHAPFHVPPAELRAPGSEPIGRRARYEAMIYAQDVILGQLLATVDLTRTLVIVVGDNGTPEDISPEPGRSKTTVYERGVHVPLVAAGPGIKVGGVSDRLVHAVDVYATVIDVGGGNPAGPGESLAGFSSTRDFVLCGHGWGELDPGANVAAVSQSGKLIWWDDNGDQVPDREEYYDLAVDPGEQVNQLHNPIYLKAVTAHRSFLLSVL